MSLTEFDQELYDRNRRREGREEGLAEGREEALRETARNLLDMGVLSHEQIAQVTGLSLADVEKLAASQ